MVKGVDLFQAHFEQYADYYAIIGGAAASEWFARQDLAFRATKDIDIVLLIEAIDDAFLKHFWGFVLAGGYEIKQRSDGRPIYYRFARPRRNDFPEMLELFSRGPSGLSLGDEQTIVPIPKEEDASSLSAILMDEDYYKVVHDFREVTGGLPDGRSSSHHTGRNHSAQGQGMARSVCPRTVRGKGRQQAYKETPKRCFPNDHASPGW
jgi:hypothetical protein